MRILLPTSVHDAIQALQEDGSVVQAGGTDLLMRIRKGAPWPQVIVDLSRLGQLLKEVRLQEGEVRLGARVSFEELAGNDLVRQTLSALHIAANVMGAVQVRTRGTLGGNLVNASPAGDGIPPLLVAQARVVMEGPGGTRELPLAEFFVGPGRTILPRGHLVTEVVYPVPAPGTRSAFRRIGARSHHVITKASMAMAARVEGGRLLDVRVAMGAVAPTPIRSRLTEDALEGCVSNADTVARAASAAMADASPIDDIRSTREYRADMCRELVGVLLADITGC